MDFTIATVGVGLVVFLSNLFLHCYFGELATESYDKMAESLNDINWTELPIETQKYIILMTANMQRPLHYHGFNVAVLDLKTFSTVS